MKKPIIVFYISVGSMLLEDIDIYINKLRQDIKESMGDDKDNCHLFFIPTKGCDATRVELLYMPPMITG